MRVSGPRRLNIGGILVEVGYSPEWRWVKRPKRGGFGSVVELVGIGVMLGNTTRGGSSKRLFLAHGFLDGVKARLLKSKYAPISDKGQRYIFDLYWCAEV